MNVTSKNYVFLSNVGYHIEVNIALTTIFLFYMSFLVCMIITYLILFLLSASIDILCILDFP